MLMVGVALVPVPLLPLLLPATYHLSPTAFGCSRFEPLGPSVTSKGQCGQAETESGFELIRVAGAGSLALMTGPWEVGRERASPMQVQSRLLLLLCYDHE